MLSRPTRTLRFALLFVVFFLFHLIFTRRGSVVSADLRNQDVEGNGVVQPARLDGQFKFGGKVLSNSESESKSNLNPRPPAKKSVAVGGADDVDNHNINGEGGDSSSERLAYVTFLASAFAPGPEDDDDRFFVATRMLVWQLLHCPETRSVNRTARSSAEADDIDIVVLVDPNVTQSRRARLRKDGAKVVEVEFIRPKGEDWLKPAKSRWGDNMIKLAVARMVDYQRILFIDADTLLAREISGVWDLEAMQVRETLDDIASVRGDEAELPARYAMAGVLEVPRDHSYPPLQHEYLSHTVFNSGFFICAPSSTLYAYYLSLLSLPGRFDEQLADQALLNYAHRLEGNMPWRVVSNEWSIRNPNQRDRVGGVRSVHEKWWKAEEFKLDAELIRWFEEVRLGMGEWYEVRDAEGRSVRGG